MILRSYSFISLPLSPSSVCASPVFQGSMLCKLVLLPQPHKWPSPGKKRGEGQKANRVGIAWGECMGCGECVLNSE